MPHQRRFAAITLSTLLIVFSLFTCIGTSTCQAACDPLLQSNRISFSVAAIDTKEDLNKKSGDEEDPSWKLFLEGMTALSFFAGVSEEEINAGAENNRFLEQAAPARVPEGDRRTLLPRQATNRRNNQDSMNVGLLFQISNLLQKNEAITEAAIKTLAEAEAASIKSVTYEEAWEKANRSIHAIINSLAETATRFREFREEALRTTPRQGREDYWTKIISWIEHQQKLWTAKLLQCQAQRTEGMTRMALTEHQMEQEKIAVTMAASLFKEAEQATIIASAAVTEAQKMTSSGKNYCLDDVIQKAHAAVKAWIKTVVFFKKDQNHLSESLQSQWKEELKVAEYEKKSWTSRFLWYETKKKEAIAHGIIDSIDEFIGEQGSVYAEKVIQEARAVEASWKKTAEALRVCETHLSEQLAELKSSFKNWTVLNIEIADNQAAFWDANALWLNILKLENLSRVARDRAVAAGNTLEGSSLWSDAFKKQCDVRDACTAFPAVCRTGFGIAPNQFKMIWLEKIQSAEEKRLLAVKRFFQYKARSAACIATIAMEEAMASSDMEAIAYWKRGIQGAKQVTTSCTELITSSEPMFAKNIKEGTVRGLQSLQKAEYQRALWNARGAWCKIQEKACRARLAINGIITIRPLEPPSRWHEVISLIEEIEHSLDRLIFFCQESSTKVHQRFKATWEEQVETLQHQKDFWALQKLFCAAQHAAILARTTIDKLGTLTPAESAACLGESLNSMITARDTWSHIEELCQGHYEQAPLRFKDLWLKKQRAANHQKECWDAMRVWVEAKQMMNESS